MPQKKKLGQNIIFCKLRQIPFEDMQSLLQKDAILNLTHSKWFRNIIESTIAISEQDYSLEVTSLRIEVIYDENGLAFSSKPFYINIEDPEDQQNEKFKKS